MSTNVPSGVSDGSGEPRIITQEKTGKQRRREEQRVKQRSNRRVDYKEKKVATREKGQRAVGVTDPDSNLPCATIRVKRRPDLREAMKGNEYSHDDPIFKEFKRIGGKGSGTVYVIDDVTEELVFAVKITEMKDMGEQDVTTYNTIFQYFEDDRAHHKPCHSNGAMVAGKMIPIGYRKSMEPGQAFGTYACKKPGSEEFFAHSMNAAYIHQLYAEKFKSLAPGLYEHQVNEHAKGKLPAVGFNYSSEDPEDFVFCSNLVFTRDGFENRGHCDNDASSYTFGIGGNVFSKTGRIASYKDGYRQQGGFFYIADYAILIDYAVIDGVCEQVWHGPDHVHSTVKGMIAPGFTRIGSSAQVNKTLKKEVGKWIKGKSLGKLVLDDWGRFYEANKEKKSV